MSYEDKMFSKNGVCKRFSARIITTRIFQQKMGKMNTGRLSANQMFASFC